VSEQIPKKLQSFLKYAIVFLVIIGLLLVFSNFKNLKRHFQAILSIHLLMPVSFSLAVYIIEGIFLFSALRLFGAELRFPAAVKCSFIINSLGYFVSLGGLTPFAAQIHVLDRYDINTKKATLSRVLQVIFFSIFFDLLLLAGFIEILINKRINKFGIATISIFICFFFLLISAFYLAIFWKWFRSVTARGFVKLINLIVGIVTKKIRIEYLSIIEFLDDFRTGFKTILKAPLSILKFVGITVIDYAALLAVMYFSFRTLNYEINLWNMVLGTTIGHIVGILSMMPGGIGTMEGSMALVYSAFGVPVETTLGAVLVYRLCFNIIPFLLSLPYYLRVSRK
jgi:uncharacterized protein (TIRG00374 family)